MILVVSRQFANGVTFNGPFKNIQLCLYHTRDHYHVITSLPAFFHLNRFCFECMKGYSKEIEHRCCNICKSCRKGKDCKRDGPLKKCQDCHRIMKSEACFKLHKHKNTVGKSTCDTFQMCKKCHKYVDLEHESDHVCGKNTCRTRHKKQAPNC